MRFNELYKLVKDNLRKGGDTISKPTFNEHIQELIGKTLLVRDEKSRQNVAYSLNYDKFRGFQGFDRLRKRIDEYFNTRPKLGVINDILGLSMIRYMLLIKVQIESLVLRRQPELVLQSLLLEDLVFRHSEDWLIEKCKQDKKYCEEVLQFLDSVVVFSRLGIFEGHEDIEQEIKSMIS